ncbi:kinase-like protein [Exidia glandulosa HHB12029]|uniref:Kinase-like protein n=1 Tax=Exidia glandulosa HHB12029 TaxID=1314781 RepID=A0A166ASC6_EXIGL|nr:kinase-like protein [Exidia glandulosa HHB12029]
MAQPSSCPHPQPAASSSSHRLDSYPQLAHRTHSQPVVETHQVHKRKGEHVINNYKIIKDLGAGQHGKVKEGRHLPREAPLPTTSAGPRRSRLPVANNIGSTENKIRKEIAIMKKCCHHHVVTLLEVIDDPMDKKIYMVLEYMEGGEIKWRDNDNNPILTVAQTRRIFRDVVLGLEYLHFQGIIHRDIKPSNLLFSADRSIVKISDFGVSHFSLDEPPEQVLMDESDLSKTAGSPAFFAPELCYQGEDPTRPLYRVTKAIDIWALGITLFCLLFGRPPLDAETEYQLYQMIPREPLKIPDVMGADRMPTAGFDNNLPHDSVGWMAIDVLKQLLEKDPTKRITIGEIKASTLTPTSYQLPTCRAARARTHVEPSHPLPHTRPS